MPPEMALDRKHAALRVELRGGTWRAWPENGRLRGHAWSVQNDDRRLPREPMTIRNTMSVFSFWPGESACIPGLRGGGLRGTARPPGVALGEVGRPCGGGDQ